MARGYRRLSAADEDEIWTMLRGRSCGQAHCARAGVVDFGSAGLPGAMRRDPPGSAASGVGLNAQQVTLGRLSLAEGEEISRGLEGGVSLRAIAAGLGRAPSTISREVAANGGRRGYRAAPADQQAWARARRRKACKLATRRRLRAMVAEKLQQEPWLPEQIAGWLKATYPHDPEMHIESLFGGSGA